MSIPVEILEEILLKLDRDSLENFCKQDTTGVCDATNEYFWRKKCRIDFGIEHRGPNCSFKDIYFGFKYYIRYKVWKYDAYIREFSFDAPDEVDLPKNLTTNEIITITDELSTVLNTNCCIFFQENGNMLLVTRDNVENILPELATTVIRFRYEPATLEYMNNYFNLIDNPEDYTINDFIDAEYVITFILE